MGRILRSLGATVSFGENSLVVNADGVCRGEAEGAGVAAAPLAWSRLARDALRQARQIPRQSRLAAAQADAAGIWRVKKTLTDD